MRRVGLALLGFAGGAAAGVIATFMAIWLWFDVLDLDGPDGSAKPGLDMLIVLGPILTLGFGGWAAWWLLRRDRAGRNVALPAVIGALALCALVVMGSSVFG